MFFFGHPVCDEKYFIVDIHLIVLAENKKKSGWYQILMAKLAVNSQHFRREISEGSQCPIWADFGL